MTQPQETSPFAANRTAFVELGDSEESFVERLATAVLLGGRCVIADLGPAEMVEWETLSALHRFADRLRERDGELVVSTGSPRLARLLRLTLLDESFTLVEELPLEEAAETGEVELELPPDHAFDAVARLVAAGVGSRAGLGADRIRDLHLALDVVRSRRALRGRTKLTLHASSHELRLEIAPIERNRGVGGHARVRSRVVDAADASTAATGVRTRLRFPSTPSGTEHRCPS